MNQQAKNTLEKIKHSAYSLVVFAEQTISAESPEAHKQQMLESVLMMLDGLEELHTDLKQAMEAV